MDRNKAIEKAVDKFFGGDVVVEIDLNDKKLIQKLVKFCAKCEKYSINQYKAKSWGIGLRAQWDKKYGFTFNVTCQHPYLGRFSSYHTFSEWIEATKMQKKFFMKARHNLAVLLRLKMKLGLPGPLAQKCVDYKDDYGFTYVPITQEEADEILKY